jgi:hypothetical protein
LPSDEITRKEILGLKNKSLDQDNRAKSCGSFTVKKSFNKREGILSFRKTLTGEQRLITRNADADQDFGALDRLLFKISR